MALGNLADLEELEPTPSRPDPLTLYHKVGTSQEGTEGRPNSGWGPLLPGDWEGAGEERGTLCVLGVLPIHFPFCIYYVHIQCSLGCLGWCSGFPGLNLSPSPCFLCCLFIVLEYNRGQMWLEH